MEDKDYYGVLGVSEDATIEEIKKAYRKLSMEHHPDKGGDEELYKTITEAYGVLSDDLKRAAYDEGEEITDEDQEIRQNLVDVFKRTISGMFTPDHMDLFSVMKGQFNERVLMLNQNLEGIGNDIRQFKAIKKKIKKGEMYKKLIDHEIYKLRTLTKQTKYDIDIMNKCIDKLGDCEYSFEDEIAGLIGALNER